MADGIIGIIPPASPTQKLDTETLTVGANTVERERNRVAGAAAAELADVKNADPAATLYGLVTRNIPPSSTTLNTPAATAVTSTSSSILASNTSRKRCRVQNVGLVTVFLGFAQTPTATVYHHALAPCSNSANDGTGGWIEDDMFDGAINAITASASGTVVVTEMT
jgi:hypothetical protein